MAESNMSPDREQGMSIFLDVFRRADKNDDNCLSWKEFWEFFSDGVMTSDELKALFQEIDTHNTDNIDTGELCAYFSKHMTSFKDIFVSIEGMNKSLNNALQKTAQDYDTMSKTSQFVTRFLMREIASQLTALQQPMETASENVDAKAREASRIERGDRSESLQSKNLPADEVRKPTGIVPGRVARRERRQYDTQFSDPHPIAGGNQLVAEITRLSMVVDRLEKRVEIGGITDEVIDVQKEELALIVHRKFNVAEKQAKAFRQSLKQYVEVCNSNDANESIQVRTYSGSDAVVVYEIWDSEDNWKAHLATQGCKNFQKSNIDHLETPEQFTTLKIPESWLK
ncbi:N-terminal EF-hand calcium-binding protein 1-like isoform X2 [Lineus longissimus]|uniref:N-terminal EF-hand calcium-binding protein 1-like isoform X2 n=1 Tax=Lineus longissimus TaxID=88925 RepID=UPI002B4F0B37